MPSPAPAAEPATAASADTAPLPAAGRPTRPAAATRLPPPAPAERSCRPCCGRSGEWRRSPCGSGRVRTSAGEHLESCAWTTSSGPPSSSSLKDLSRGWRNGSLHQVIQHPPRPPYSRALAPHARHNDGASRWMACVGMRGRRASESAEVEQTRLHRPIHPTRLVYGRRGLHHTVGGAGRIELVRLAYLLANDLTVLGKPLD